MKVLKGSKDANNYPPTEANLHGPHPGRYMSHRTGAPIRGINGAEKGNAHCEDDERPSLNTAPTKGVNCDAAHSSFPVTSSKKTPPAPDKIAKTALEH